MLSISNPENLDQKLLAVSSPEHVFPEWPSRQQIVTYAAVSTHPPSTAGSTEFMHLFCSRRGGGFIAAGLFRAVIAAQCANAGLLHHLFPRSKFCFEAVTLIDN
jgi:hypothetical protein